MIEYETFLKRLGETKLPAHGTLFRVLDDFCEDHAYYRDDGSGLPATEVMLEGLGRQIWRGLVEVVEIERKEARKLERAAIAAQRKGPRVAPQSP